jgi:hypothetical protein
MVCLWLFVFVLATGLVLSPLLAFGVPITATLNHGDTLRVHDPGPYLPSWPATYVMNQSTIIMPCNFSGYTDPQSVAGWGIVDFDWSNSKELWAKDKPMLCEERMLIQAQMINKVSPQTRVWVYRNSIKALPWFTSVRETLTDARYSKWFLTFSHGVNGTYHVPPCDPNYSPALCSPLYHDQTQTPGFPHGDGDCAAPACDVGTVPVGEYLWDPRAANVSVLGVTLLDFLIHHYALNIEGGGSDLIDGLFFDDYWFIGGPSEVEAHALHDMGIGPGELIAITDAYHSNMRAIQAAVIAAGKFSWQLLWSIGGTCAGPIVRRDVCAEDLRLMCRPDSPAQTRAIMAGFAPGGCKTDPEHLEDFDADLANFLLIRGDYAWLGHAWLGCSRTYVSPPGLHVDYGTPLGLCQETAPDSRVFVREWTRATVSMDCTTWTPHIAMKP